MRRHESITAEQIPRIDLLADIVQCISAPVGDNHVGLLLELRQIIDHPGVEKITLVQHGLVNDDLNALGLDALHDPLDAGGPEVIRTRLHDQAIDPDRLGVALDDLVGNEILARRIRLNNRVNEVLRNFAVIGQQLLGVLGQTITAVTKAGVVVVTTDTRVHTHAVNNLAGIQPVSCRVSIKLVEVGNPHRQKGVGKQLDRLGLGAVGKQDRNILLDGPLPEQIRKDLCPLGALANDNSRRMKVVVERPAFPQKLRRKNKVLAAELLFGLLRIAHRHRGLDDHERIRIDGHYILDHRLDGPGVEVIGLRVVIGRRGNDDDLSPDIGLLLIQRGPEIKRLAAQIVLDLPVFDRRHLLVEHAHLLGKDIQRNNLIVLRQQDGVGKTYIAGTGDSDFHDGSKVEKTSALKIPKELEHSLSNSG